jgi:hypothetical protein
MHLFASSPDMRGDFGPKSLLIIPKIEIYPMENIAVRRPNGLELYLLQFYWLWCCGRTSHPAVPIPSRENYSLKGQSSRTMCTAMQPPPVDGCFFIELDFLESVFARSFQLRSSLQGAKCFYK